MSMNGRVALPLIFYQPTDLLPLSNKRNWLVEVFKLFDTRALTRIDALELLSVICLCTSGTLEGKINNIAFIFSFTYPGVLTREELHLLLDVLVRGVTKIALRNSDTFYPR